jgi:hypothetical protein
MKLFILFVMLKLFTHFNKVSHSLKLNINPKVRLLRIMGTYTICTF